MSFVSGLMFGATLAVPFGALVGALSASRAWRRHRSAPGQDPYPSA
jgi:hypothetical protein